MEIINDVKKVFNKNLKTNKYVLIEKKMKKQK